MTVTGIRVFVNGSAQLVPQGATARDAVRSFDPELGHQLDEGRAYVTDGRGVRLSPEAPLSAGSILRVVASTRRRAEGDDAHA